MITVCLLGIYQDRLPLAYPAIRSLCANAIALTDRITGADVVAVAHARDLSTAAESLHPGQRLVLLSEEPLWDTVWSPDPLTREQYFEIPNGKRVPFTVLNHHTSGLYNFDEIPYFLLTDPAYFNRYSTWLARRAGRSVESWRAHFATVHWHIAFLAEMRSTVEFDSSWPEHDLFGMGALRTRIALACNRARVLRSGAGWNTLPRRQDLPDWHLEKFIDLNGRCRFLSAVENTHQNNYVSEKVFDAYACGAVPLYIAGPHHRVRELVPEEAFVNLYGLSPEEVAVRLMDLPLDTVFLETYAAAHDRLAALFATPAALRRERHRLRAALVHELEQVLAA